MQHTEFAGTQPMFTVFSTAAEAHAAVVTRFGRSAEAEGLQVDRFKADRFIVVRPEAGGFRTLTFPG